jgi:BMFP domain-containing protein YqiC
MSESTATAALADVVSKFVTSTYQTHHVLLGMIEALHARAANDPTPDAIKAIHARLTTLETRLADLEHRISRHVDGVR